MSVPFTSPAPWSVNTNGGAITVVSRDQFTVATLGHPVFDGNDARLVAAAPELVEALRDAREWILGEGSIVPERLVGRISAALAKVDGR